MVFLTIWTFASKCTPFLFTFLILTSRQGCHRLHRRWLSMLWSDKIQNSRFLKFSSVVAIDLKLFWFFFSKQFSMHPTSVLLASSPGFLTGYTKLQLTRIKVFFLYQRVLVSICTWSIQYLHTFSALTCNYWFVWFSHFCFWQEKHFCTGLKVLWFEFLSSDGKPLFYGCSSQF